MEPRERAINRNLGEKNLKSAVAFAYFIINDIVIVIINLSPYITGTLLQLMTHFPCYLTLNLCLSILN